ncbi:hypothetical protein [Aureispira anguillae]|uniref:Uncharacterized protein n=1 Tax=Aureispira anguillae TaxID=2864201 RepID=A0A915YGY2_9BACT|nr:hypothetical protein [Aureispira anguillae]BDS12980.1 hypothetical protein AsAng_0037080 [Aureispira anguillae]
MIQSKLQLLVEELRDTLKRKEEEVVNINNSYISSSISNIKQEIDTFEAFTKKQSNDPFLMDQILKNFQKEANVIIERINELKNT